MLFLSLKACCTVCIFYLYTYRLVLGVVLMSSTESTLKYCPWWPSRSCLFCLHLLPGLRGSCLKEGRSLSSGHVVSSSPWTQVSATKKYLHRSCWRIKSVVILNIPIDTVVTTKPVLVSNWILFHQDFIWENLVCV